MRARRSAAGTPKIVGGRRIGALGAVLAGLLLHGCASPPPLPPEPAQAPPPEMPMPPPAPPAPLPAAKPALDPEPEPDPEELFDPADPWGPFIIEASETFDVPEEWIRAVIQHESGGRAFVKGRPIRGPAGSIGLMQIAPDTFRAVSRKYGLGTDPGDPYDNIMAGTALIRELFEEFGSPFFLAAYNCGPGCAAKAAAGRRKLPSLTRRYLSTVGSSIRHIQPERPDWSIKELVKEPPGGYGG